MSSFHWSVVVVFAVQLLYVHGNLSCGSNGISNSTNHCAMQGMASIELYCSTDGIKVSFKISELDAKNLPWKIKYTAPNNTCGTWNKTSTDCIDNGRIWLISQYSDCNTTVETEGDMIAFKQQIVVEYGSMLTSKLVYRYFNDTYNVKCLLDRNVTHELGIDVAEQKNGQANTTKTENFEFDFKVLKEDNSEVSGLVYIGEKLKFNLDLKTSSGQVVSSPQDCFATRMDDTGKYDLIKDKCEGESTVKITSLQNEQKKFSWEMVAFRYFGNTNGVKITCRVILCAGPNKGLECSRCNKNGERKRRAVGDEDGSETVKFVTSPIIFIMERDPQNTNSADDLFEKPEVVAIVAVLSVFILTICAVLIKKFFFPATAASAAEAKKVKFGLENKAYNN